MCVQAMRGDYFARSSCSWLKKKTPVKQNRRYRSLQNNRSSLLAHPEQEKFRSKKCTTAGAPSPKGGEGGGG